MLMCSLNYAPGGEIVVPLVKPEKQHHPQQHHTARSEDGRLYYDGEWYGRGQSICIDKKDEYPTR